jgi:flagellar biosynthesis protein FlhF
VKVASFIAESPAAALAKIHEQLGPEAVVLSVRPAPASGLSRLWHKNRAVEVLAGVPEPEASTASHLDQYDAPDSLPLSHGPSVQHGGAFNENAAPEARSLHPMEFDGEAGMPRPTQRPWRSIARLETMGLLPVFADRLEERVCARQGATPPLAPGAEWQAVCDAFSEYWRTAPPLHDDSGRPHVFIGPPGVGKTTLLCKWLATSVLLEERATRVWRLDGSNANTAELLDVYGEMFGLAVERFWRPGEASAGLSLVDLPGVETNDAAAMSALKEQLAGFPSPRVHLVLNAAYDTPVLFEQFRAFAAFQPEDLSFTHLDEEQRRTKLWNFVLGTSCPLCFLSAGQKIPGDFCPAQAPLLFRGSNVAENIGIFALRSVRPGSGKGPA